MSLNHTINISTSLQISKPYLGLKSKENQLNASKLLPNLQIVNGQSFVVLNNFEIYLYRVLTQKQKVFIV